MRLDQRIAACIKTKCVLVCFSTIDFRGELHMSIDCSSSCLSCVYHIELERPSVYVGMTAPVVPRLFLSSMLILLGVVAYCMYCVCNCNFIFISLYYISSLSHPYVLITEHKVCITKTRYHHFICHNL